MFIIFGIRSSRIKNISKRGYNCLHCLSQDSVHVFYYVKYFHIFYIPVFPISRYAVSACGHCKQALNYYQMSNSLKEAADTDKPKIPVKYFAGLIVFATPILVVMLIAIFEMLLGHR
jgi:hypothetical protein